MRSAAHLSIESMCRLGQVSRAGFYRHWKEHEPRAEQTELRARMHQIVCWPTGATTATGG